MDRFCREKFFTILVLLCEVLNAHSAEDSMPFISLKGRDLSKLKTFKSDDSSNYRTLALDEASDTLFIGARNGVFGLNLADITQDSFSAVMWPASADVETSCKSLPKFKDGKKCYNLIQIVQPMNHTHVFLCGTNALTPTNKFLKSVSGDGYSLAADDGGRSPLCSFDPEDSISSLVTGGHIFSTGRSDLQSKMSVMKSTPGRLVMSNENMQEEHTNFVAAFQAEDSVAQRAMNKVYFVSDEKAEEPDVYGAYAPTVTQVCVNDVGGKNILHNEWTSLLKIRLLCQTVAEHPLVFDLITHAVLEDGILYATFTTRHDTARANAVCSFKLSDVQYGFNHGEFWEEEQTSKSYRKVQAPDNSLRPGMCAYGGMQKNKPQASTSEDFPESHLAFMREHHLVTDVIKPSHPNSTGGTVAPPLLIKNGDKFTQIAIDKVNDLSGMSHSALFVATEKGVVLKYLYITKGGDEMEMVELAKYVVSNLPIVNMKISPKHSKLYIATDDAVHQVSTANCGAYTQTCSFCDPCRMCILSRDPYCAWSGQQCVSVKDQKDNHDLLQDVSNGGAETQCKGLSQSSIHKSEVKVQEGATEILGHVVLNPIINYIWYKVKNEKTKERIEENSKYRITKDGQLEISDFNAVTDMSKYECEYTAHSTTVAKTVFTVLSSTNVPPVTLQPVTDEPKSVPTSASQHTTADRVLGRNSTAVPGTITPVEYAGLNTSIIGVIIIIPIVLVLLAVCFAYTRRKRSYNAAAGKKGTDNVDMEDAKPLNRDNSTNNNNTQMAIQRMSSTREETPLIASSVAELHEKPKEETLVGHLPGTSKSCDFLNTNTDLPYIDAAAPNGRFSTESEREGITVEPSSSLREDGGRKRVPPNRTKSMPGSTIYVVFGGKKLACSTLQRNQKGWVIEVPKQLGMSGMAGDEEEDELIEFVHDTQAADNSSQFEESGDQTSFSPSSKTTKSTLKDARKAFFEPGGGDQSPANVYVTSTPTNLPQSSGKTKPFKGQSSRSSLRSNGQNSSEELDSDSTVKSSSSTLKQEYTPSLKHNPVKVNRNHPHHPHQNEKGSTVQMPTAMPTSDDVHNQSPIQANNKRLEKAESDLSLDRSGSSGDEQLHGRDKDVTRKGQSKPPDSPSSSSSSEYRSARSSVVSDPPHDQR